MYYGINHIVVGNTVVDQSIGTCEQCITMHIFEITVSDGTTVNSVAHVILTPLVGATIIN